MVSSMNRCRLLVVLLNVLWVSALLASARASASDAAEALGRDTFGIVTGDGIVRLAFDLGPATPGHSYEVDVSAGANLPVAGRWNDDSTESVGWFRPVDGRFFLRVAQSDGPATSEFSFFDRVVPEGPLFPLMGDWNGSGIATAGVFDQSQGVASLKNENSREAPIVYKQSSPGVVGPNWLPVAGDWNGSGRDQVGFFNGLTMTLHILDDPPGMATTLVTLPVVGGTTLRPMAGDWDRTGTDGFGLLDVESDKVWLLFSVDDASAWDLELPVSATDNGWPVAGSWDGDSLRYEAPRTPGGARPGVFPQVIKAQDPGHHLYFTADSETLAGVQSIFYNRRIVPSLFSNDGWQFSESIEVLGTAGATALGVVLRSDAQPFRDPAGEPFDYLMVLVVEQNDDPVTIPYAGWVCISFGTSPVDWTEPIFATTSRGVAPRPCVDPDPVPDDNPPVEILAELVSGFRYGDELYFGVMNGNNPELLQDALASSPRTQTYLYTTSVEQPWSWSNRGEFQQRITTPNVDDLWNHNFGINTDLTYDDELKSVLWTRSYSYPFDLEGGIPCSSDGTCPDGPRLNPNRFQVYELEQPCSDPGTSWLNSGFVCPSDDSSAKSRTRLDFERIPDYALTLLLDGGSSLGYPKEPLEGECGPTPLIPLSAQTGFLGLDVNSATFVKTFDGWVDRDSDGKRTLVFGGTNVKDKSVGECDFTDASMYLWREP
ncbi:MAG: hypothetical protein AAGC60_24925 [Acidobacteriota bacterium]